MTTAPPKVPAALIAKLAGHDRLVAPVGILVDAGTDRDRQRSDGTIRLSGELRADAAVQIKMPAYP